MGWLFGKKEQSISEIDFKISRDELIRRCRILVVDDEQPEIINDLKASHFSIDYVPDIDTTNIDLIESPLYDLIILDFGNVGKSFGQDEGLSLLRHIKRLNPSIFVLAYTSKSLGTEHADFYRLANGVLAKDAGISESTSKIEEGLRIALSPENLWNGLIQIAGISPGGKEDLEWQNLFVKGLKDKKSLDQLKKRLTELSTNGTKKVAFVVLEKLVELGIMAYIGG
jgi:CheY-like chemotaxis protein